MYGFDISFWQHHTLLAVFVVSVIIQVIYYLFMFSGLAFYKLKNFSDFTKPVSIIICAKNEAKNLLHHLPGVLSQNYPDFEVIVVNDQSTDNTEDVLKAFQLQYPKLKIVTTPLQNKRDYFSKKMAVTLGIKAASNEHLVFIDADCRPASELWLKKITAPFSQENIKIVLGYSPYEKKNTLLNYLIGFDTWMIGLQYLSFAQRKLPYMGVGRNLAYVRSLFFANKGFASHMHISSGDDDLFIQETATKNNSVIVPQKEAQTISLPEQSFKDWIFQKQRHLQTSVEYKPLIRFLLGLFSISLTLFVILFPVLIITEIYVYLIFGLAMMKYLIQFVIFNLVNKYLNDNRVVYLFWLLEPLLVVIYMYLFAKNMVQNFLKWV
jgi:glycosyltransferase involved in cell wall biosynthesis